MKFIGLDGLVQARVEDVLRLLGVANELEEIEVKKLPVESEECIHIGRGEKCFIYYKETHHFFRALGLYVQLAEDFTASFERKERATIKTCGAMIDCSRNAVYKVDVIKDVLMKMALMGHKSCMLYTEDTYEIEGNPYFGYLRGRYSKKELKAMDDYAYSLGIEMIPCIQTLAHLNQSLRWDVMRDKIDMDDILLVGEKKTYELIEEMLKTYREVFRSKQIHIGMDEAYNLGRGAYLDRNGHKPHYEIMLEHLKEVVAIAKKYDFKPMMWDDMFQRTNHSYDPNMAVSKDITENIPQELSLVYWDYYHEDPSHYDKTFTVRKDFCNPIIFAGGVWKWEGFAPSYEKTMATSKAALMACKKYGINEVIATMWGDDGEETPLYTTMMGLILFAEHCYAEEVSSEWLEKRCHFLTGLSVEDFMSMEDVNLIPGVERPNYKVSNPSKYFLYQDILLGAFDKHAEDEAIGLYYRNLVKKYEAIIPRAGNYTYLFNMYKDLSQVLANKYNLGVKLREAYLKEDKEILNDLITHVGGSLAKDLEKLHKSVEEAWYKERKGHGYEIVDLRIGGVEARLKSTMTRVKAYLDGEITEIEELEDERLLFARHKQGKFGCHNQYALIASQNVFGHNLMEL